MPTSDVDSVTERLMRKLAEPSAEPKRSTSAGGAAPGAAAEATGQRRPRGARAANAAVWTAPGLGPMTPVPTMLGMMPAGALRERDLIRTESGEYRPLTGVDKMVLDEEFLSLHPEALPVMVRRDSIRRGVPKVDLMLSPGQPLTPRIRTESGCRVALDLVGRPGVTRKAEAMFTYIVLEVAQPSTVAIDAFRIEIGPADAIEDA